MDDTQTIQAVLGGDRNRYADLVDRHKKMVYGIAWSQLGDGDLSEDAAQETFVKAYRHLRTLRDPDRFGWWLAQIARNVCRTFQRRAARESAFLNRWTFLESTSPTQLSEKPVAGSELTEAFSALSPTYREALTVFYIEDKSIAESAAILGISEPAMKVRLHRGRMALRGQLELRLETTLDRLQPGDLFTNSVMGVLPLLPNTAAGVGSAIGVLGKLTLGLSAFWMVLLSAAPAAGVSLWFSSMADRSILDTPENKFRKARIRQAALPGVLVIVGIVLVVGILIHAFAPVTPAHRSAALALRIAFGCFCTLPLLNIWPLAERLRVNRSPVIYGRLFYNIVALLCYAGIAFAGAPPVIYVLSGLTSIIVEFFIRRELSPRGDYSIFLRCATGGVADVPPASIKPGPSLTDKELQEFARFLGRQWLVRDFVIAGDKMTLYLTLYLSRMHGSMMTVTRDGIWSAELSRSDLAAVDRVTGLKVDPAELKECACRVIAEALRRFRENDVAGARSAITAKSDATIFDNRARIHAEITGYVVSLAVMAFYCLTLYFLHLHCLI